MLKIQYKKNECYSLNSTRLREHMPLWIIFGIFLFRSSYAVWEGGPIMPNLPLILTLFALPYVVIILYLALLINYYRAARDKVLILPKNKDLFYYGPSGHPQQFDKKDILEIVSFGLWGIPIEHLGFVRIEMRANRGRYIYIPSIMHSGPRLLEKFPGCPLQKKKKLIPFIPPSR
jgi:hypothetical protein